MRRGKDFRFSFNLCLRGRIFVSLLTGACGEEFSFLYQAVCARKDFRFSSNLCVQEFRFTAVRAGKDFRFSTDLCVRGRIFVSLLTCACWERFSFLCLEVVDISWNRCECCKHHQFRLVVVKTETKT